MTKNKINNTTLQSKQMVRIRVTLSIKREALNRFREISKKQNRTMSNLFESISNILYENPDLLGRIMLTQKLDNRIEKDPLEK